MSEVTRILSAIEHGDPHAASELLPLVYAELRNVFDLSQKHMKNRTSVYVENDGRASPRHIDHVAMRTLRPAEMAEFYREVFELAPAKIERKGVELLWDAASLPSEPLASSDWVIKDVGFAYRIGMRLVAENRLLDLQLPHPMDLRYL